MLLLQRIGPEVIVGFFAVLVVASAKGFFTARRPSESFMIFLLSSVITVALSAKYPTGALVGGVIGFIVIAVHTIFWSRSGR